MSLWKQNKKKPKNPDSGVISKPSCKLSAAVNSRINAAREFFIAYRLKSAMEEIMAVLDVSPGHKEALELAQEIICAQEIAISNEEIPRGILLDTLLDSLFNQCHKCFRSWICSPLHRKSAGIVVTCNPRVGLCPQCKKVWCHDCAVYTGIESIICPECRENLEVIRQPLGRKLGVRPAKRPHLRPVLVYVFKAPPEPRNMRSYGITVLDVLCPEAFKPGVVNHFETGKGADNDVYAITRILTVAERSKLEIDEELIFGEAFNDSEGGHGRIFACYQKK